MALLLWFIVAKIVDSIYREKSEYKIALHCNTVSSKAVSTNQANKNTKWPWLGTTEGRLKSYTIFAIF